MEASVRDKNEVLRAQNTSNKKGEQSRHCSWLFIKGPQFSPLPMEQDSLQNKLCVNCCLFKITLLQSYLVPDAEKQSHKEAFI